MKKTSNKRNGFTLAELLVVVAIIAVLVVIAVAVFGGSKEKAAEATDLANIRNAYGELSVNAMLTDSPAAITVNLVQEKDGWISGSSAPNTLAQLGTVSGTPAALGTCVVSWDDENNTVVFSFDGSGASEGPSTSGNVVDRSARKYIGDNTDIKDVAVGIADYIYDVIKITLNGNAGNVRYRGSTNNSEDGYRELATDYRVFEISSMLDLGIDWGNHSTWRDNLEGTDMTADTFTTAISGSNTEVYLDLTTNLPIAVTYYKDGTSNSDYMITYLDENGDPTETRDLGTKNGMRNAFPYNKEFVLSHFEEDTAPPTNFGFPE